MYHYHNHPLNEVQSESGTVLVSTYLKRRSYPHIFTTRTYSRSEERSYLQPYGTHYILKIAKHSLQ